MSGLTKKRIVTAVLVVTGCLLAIEVAGRIVGITNPPLYIESPEYQYIYAPDQNVTVFGNRIITNEYSMRSLPLSEDDYLRILLIGDSVIHGGKHVDHSLLASTLLEDSLSTRFHRKIRVLNVSAGGWGPDNIFAYIKKYGTFNAPLMVLVVSSHDYASRMSSKKIVGIIHECPARRPVSVLFDLSARYVLPWLCKNVIPATNNQPQPELTSYTSAQPAAYGRNPGLDSLVIYAKKSNVKLVAILHATQSELKAQTYNNYGLELVHYFDSCGIVMIPEIKNNPGFKNFIDDIHYNEKGQRVLFNELFPVLLHYADNYCKQN